MKHLTHRLIGLLLLLAPLAALAQNAHPNQVRLSINDRAIESDGAALLLEGSLFVSSDILASDLGLQARDDKGLWHLQSFSHEFALRSGERTVQVDGRAVESTVAPVQRGETLYVPIQLLREPLSLTVTHEGDGWQITSPPGTLLQVRQGIHEDRVRFVLDLAAPTCFRMYEEPGKVVVELPVPPGTPEVLRMHQFEDTLADQVTESVQDGFIRVVISHQSPEPVQVFTLGDPARLGVDLMRAMPVPEPTAPPRPLPPAQPGAGDLWMPCQFTGAKGPVRAFVIRFRPGADGWALRPALAGSTIMQRRSVSRIASANQAYAGVNGGFFASQGPPLGMLMIDGEWIKAPLYCRAVLGITRDGSYQIANVDFDGQVVFEGLGMLPLDRINEGHVESDSVVAYTQRWGPVVVGAPDKTRLAVNAEGLVTAIYPPNMDAPIPHDGFVVSGNGQRAQTLACIAQGTRCKLDLATNPQWPGLRYALGGGPLLVNNGKIVLNARAERFRDDVANGSHARSAVGLTASGDVILLAVDKPGLTLGELARVMLKLHANCAMNLDGGGSTAFVVNGRVLNSPSDGAERAVSNALLVVKP